MTTDLPYETWFWVGFILLILILLVVDLGYFHRSAHRIGLKESLIWTGAWVGLALIFGSVIWFYGDMNSLLQYLSGYLIEESLSMDNLFVFLIIFSYFSIPEKFRYTVLFWGIIGALVFRGLFIFAGVELLRQFQWVLYILGGFLVYTGIRMALRKGEEVKPEKNPVLKLARKYLPVSDRLEGKRFFISRDGKWLLTPLFVVLVVIETTDIMFAVDSIPAVLSVSRDPFIVFSSNVFAVLGLRALFFALSGIMKLFEYLHYGLATILSFVGVKMLLSEWVNIPVWIALLVIVLVLSITIVGSVFHKLANTSRHNGL